MVDAARILRKSLLTFTAALTGCGGIGVGHHSIAPAAAHQPFKLEPGFVYFKFLEPAQGEEDVVASTHDEANAQALTELPDVFSREFVVLVDVVGHADAAECAEVDCVALSTHRAQLVLDYLKSHGVPTNRLGKAYGLAASHPVALTSRDGDGRFNRRVEFVVYVTPTQTQRNLQ